MVRLAAVLLCFFASTAGAQMYQGKRLVEAELVADTATIVPGQPFRVGLHLRMAPGWHIYWKNPGDSGIATAAGWNMPDNFAVCALQWPLPQRLVEPGDIEVYAYKDETLLVAEVTPPKTIAGKEITLRATPKWLVCEQICIPGAAELELTLPVAASASSANAALFRKFSAELPAATAPPFGMTWTRTPNGWNLALRDVVDAGRVDFYPYANEKAPVGHTVAQTLEGGAAGIAIPVDGSPDIEGLLVVENGRRRGWIVSSKQNTAPAAQKVDRPASGLLRYLLLGFLGGLILNLMPCVLPVISLKIFGFMRQAGDSRADLVG